MQNKKRLNCLHAVTEVLSDSWFSPFPMSGSSYGTEYVQNSGGRCSGHWKGTPPGGTAAPCWCCLKGCAVLCCLALRGLTPNETNIKATVNDKAECTWVGFKPATAGSTPTYPCIGKRTGIWHFVIITGEKDAAKYRIWDPSAGVDKCATLLSSRSNFVFRSSTPYLPSQRP